MNIVEVRYHNSGSPASQRGKKRGSPELVHFWCQKTEGKADASFNGIGGELRGDQPFDNSLFDGDHREKTREKEDHQANQIQAERTTTRAGCG